MNDGIPGLNDINTFISKTDEDAVQINIGGTIGRKFVIAGKECTMDDILLQFENIKSKYNENDPSQKRLLEKASKNIVALNNRANKELSDQEWYVRAQTSIRQVVGNTVFKLKHHMSQKEILSAHESRNEMRTKDLIEIKRKLQFHGITTNDISPETEDILLKLNDKNPVIFDKVKTRSSRDEILKLIKDEKEKESNAADKQEKEVQAATVKTNIEPTKEQRLNELKQKLGITKDLSEDQENLLLLLNSHHKDNTKYLKILVTNDDLRTSALENLRLRKEIDEETFKKLQYMKL